MQGLLELSIPPEINVEEAVEIEVSRVFVYGGSEEPLALCPGPIFGQTLIGGGSMNADAWGAAEAPAVAVGATMAKRLRGLCMDRKGGSALCCIFCGALFLPGCALVSQAIHRHYIDLAAAISGSPSVAPSRWKRVSSSKMVRPISVPDLGPSCTSWFSPSDAPLWRRTSSPSWMGVRRHFERN